MILTLPILVGTDGVQKMGKSVNNYIGVMEPRTICSARSCRSRTSCIEQYFALVHRRAGGGDRADGVRYEDRRRSTRGMRSGGWAGRSSPSTTPPRRRTAADETFLRVFSAPAPADARGLRGCSRGGKLSRLTCAADPSGSPPSSLSLAWPSPRAKRRAWCKGGGVYVDERRITDPQEEVTLTPGMLLRVGKRKVA